jgi:hypothetical protein
MPRPYKIITKQPTGHGILGGPDDLVPKENEKCEGQWELWGVMWDQWKSPWICDKHLFGFLWCIKGHYECTYRYTAIWKCSTSGKVTTTSKRKTVVGDCRTFG